MDDSAAFPRPTQDDLSWDIAGLFRGAIRLVLECVLQEEVKELVGARRYERLSGRKDHLNGTYLRRLLTSMGLIELSVPRSRANGSPIDVIGRYKRRSGEIDRMVTTAYVEGVSTRDMKRVTQALMGEGLSRSTVSRVTQTLAQQVDELRHAPISEPMPYLYLDATFSTPAGRARWRTSRPWWPTASAATATGACWVWRSGPRRARTAGAACSASSSSAA